mgnify:CR=1 FL=1
MNEVVTFLQANPVQYPATVGRDGRAKCRPFMFAGALDGKLWFCTNTTKDVYRDMQGQPLCGAVRFQRGLCMAAPERQGCLFRQHGSQGAVPAKPDRPEPVR